MKSQILNGYTSEMQKILIRNSKQHVTEIEMCCECLKYWQHFAACSVSKTRRMKHLFITAKEPRGLDGGELEGVGQQFGPTRRYNCFVIDTRTHPHGHAPFAWEGRQLCAIQINY